MGLPFWMEEVEDIRLRYKRGAVPDQRDMRVVLSALDAANTRIEGLGAEVKVLEEYVVTIGGAIKDLADLSDSMVDVPEEE